jgi:SNF2 family DNA or RNA helicase
MLVDGDLSDEKVVIFIRYKNGVRSLQARLQRAGVGFETIWGEDRDKSLRAIAQERFWSDDNCRVMIGTQAIEQSLNFQCARHLVNFDLIPNPARMEQLVGRIRRDGSAHPHVYVHNLLTANTHESRLLAKLEVEQALIDAVWDEKSDLFAGLTPLQMMQLIAP